MGVPRRLRQQEGRYALVDGIPFTMPVNAGRIEALLAGFPIDPERARGFLPGNELHPARVWRRGLLLVTVVNYQSTDIGKYIEFSVGIACTRGRGAAPPLLPLLLRGRFGFGQYVVDLPVSTEISVKGGKGIWGMPKHQASLDFVVGENAVSSQYDDDGQMVMRIEIARPGRERMPLRVSAANYCQFRGLLMKSYVHFRGRAGFALGPRAGATLELGEHPRLHPLRELDIAPKPLFTGFFPHARGVLDDYFESWFLSYEQPPGQAPEGFEGVIGLGLGRDWLDPPRREPQKTP
jgi:hypothetical protein